MSLSPNGSGFVYSNKDPALPSYQGHISPSPLPTTPTTISSFKHLQTHETANMHRFHDASLEYHPLLASSAGPRAQPPSLPLRPDREILTRRNPQYVVQDPETGPIDRKDSQYS